MHILRAWRPSVVACLITFATWPVFAQTTIQYFYDELGRLIAVVDPGGDTATYTYDAVGNILSIGRHPSSQVSIIAFSPTSGPVGTVVTISGTGFSTTAIQDAVTFNGTAATVSSASATQLVVTVPSGATTGTIGVTAPGGSATSATSFTVTSLSLVPTVTSFTPTIGVAATAVTVSGTNFDSVAANNRVALNLTRVPLSSSTSTSIAASVPYGGTSGHVAVTTVAGKGVSAGFFFVPPGAYGVSDVQFTGSVATGGSMAVTISTATKVGLVVFDGTAGQRVSLKMTNSSISSTDVTIFKPDGTSLASVLGFGTGGGFIDTATLPTAGTYTILVDPQGQFTGSVTVNLYAVTDLTASPASGSGYAATFTTPGQNLKLTYAGTAGQRMSMNVTSVSLSGGIGNNGYAVSILNPDGSTLVSPTSFAGSGFVDSPAMATTGTYTVLIDPASSATGTLTATGYVFTDVSGSLTSGSAQTFSTSTPGQNGRYTFSGTAGQKASLNLTSVTITSTVVTIQNPDGSTLASVSATTAGAFIDAHTLGSTGTYTVVIDPQSTNTGNMTVTAYTFSDVSGTLTLGTGFVVSITSPGQNASLTFSGTAGQKISMRLTSVTIGSSTPVTILKPDSTTLATVLYPSASFLDATSLPTTGTYTVTVDPALANTGNMTVTVYSFSDLTGTLTFGSPSTISIASPGQNARLTFSGTANQKVSLVLSNVTLSNYNISLLRPDNSTQATLACCLLFMDSQTLATTGTYTILVDPPTTATGNVTLTLYDSSDVTGTVTIGGSSVPVTLSNPGQNGVLTFSGISGQVVTVHVTSSTINSLTVTLKNPDGSTLTSKSAGTGSFDLTQKTLPSTGTYTILIDPSSSNTGSLNVSVSNP